MTETIEPAGTARDSAIRHPSVVSAGFLLAFLSATSVAYLPSVSGSRQQSAFGAGLTANPIVLENQLAGSNDWPIKRSSPNHEIEGYASTTSISSGETFALFVNVSAAGDTRWQAFRMGFYQGLGARLVASGGPAPVSPQPGCTIDRQTILIECGWAPTFYITPDSDWVTGQYLIKLIRYDGFESYVPLTVREASPRAPLLFQASVTTWQAYNSWGGASLYVNAPSQTGVQNDRAYRVSFDRPYLEANGAGELLRFEVYMLRWLEQRGYDVAYVTNLDVASHPELLLGRHMFLTVGHDEYWSVGERNAVEGARDAGVSLGFFSANTGYWRIRLEPSSQGTPQRVVTCYKDASIDPLGGTADATTLWRDPPFARPENSLLGVMYEVATVIDAFPLVVTNPTHWIYEGTGVTYGETLPHILGYEWDHIFDNGLTPPGLETLAHAMGIYTYGSQVAADSTVYYPSSSSIVFATGTIEWAWGLSHPDYLDPRIQRITENVLAKAGLPVGVPTSVPPLPPPTEPGDARAVTLVAGTGEPGYLDGPADVARFNAPAGVAAAPDGTLYVTEARNHRIRAISPGGIVTTIAGCGPSDSSSGIAYRDGIGLEACFNVPTGIAVDSAGSVYVSDTFNQSIRAIDPGSKAVTTYAGSWQKGFVDAADPRSARFSYPRGIAFGPDGALYVADSGNGAIRRIGSSGVKAIATGLSYPTGVAVAADGTVYTLETSPPAIARFQQLKQGEPPVFGKREVLAGGQWGDAGGPGSTARLRPIEGLALSGQQLIISDTANYRVRMLDLSGVHNVTTLVGDGRFGAGEGSGATARTVLPRGLTNYYNGIVVADSGNNRLIAVQPGSLQCVTDVNEAAVGFVQGVDSAKYLVTRGTASMTMGDLPPGIDFLAYATTEAGLTSPARTAEFRGNPQQTGNWQATLENTDLVTGCPVQTNVNLTVSLPSDLSSTPPSKGIALLSTYGTNSQVQSGWGVANAEPGSGVPSNVSSLYATAVIQYAQSGFITSESGIPVVPPGSSSRIFVDYREGVVSGAGTIDVFTGIAVANPGLTTARITLKLRDGNGVILTTGTASLAPMAHTAKFLNQMRDIAPDFSVPPDFAAKTGYGSLEITSDQPVSILALRMTVNQRGDVIYTTTPTTDLTQSQSFSPLYLAQIADGGGWRTTIIFLNSSDSADATGMLKFLDDTGGPLTVRVGGAGSSSSFPYRIPPGGFLRVETDGSPATARVGSALLLPDAGSEKPVAGGVFQLTKAGILITESGVPSAVPTLHAKIYIDKSDGHDTGLALVNTGATPSQINVQALGADGATFVGEATLQLSGHGHTARFAGQLIPGGLPDGFRGILDVSSSTPFAALTLRSLLNARGDFLVSTFPLADVNSPAPTPMVFPQVADGNGYATEFVYLNAGGVDLSTTTRFYDDFGSALELGTFSFTASGLSTPAIKRAGKLNSPRAGLAHPSRDPHISHNHR